MSLALKESVSTADAGAAENPETLPNNPAPPVDSDQADRAQSGQQATTASRRRELPWLLRHHPTLYLVLSAALAGVGYGFLLFFPALAAAMAVSLAAGFMGASSSTGWAGIALQGLLLALGAAGSYAAWRLRFLPPSGVELTAQSSPQLFKLLDELGEIFGHPRIDRVVLRDRFEVRVVSTPRNGFPFAPVRTLIVGLPVLQTLSPLDVHVLLARRLGQLSGRDGRVHSWLFLLRDLWVQYRVNCSIQQSPLSKLLWVFFRFYSPLYQGFTAAIARVSELAADRYALDSINDRDTVRGITAQAVTEDFLAQIFWPKMEALAQEGAVATLRPHSQMARVVQGGIPRDEVQAALRRVWERDEGPRSSMPALSERLDNLGYQSPLPPKALPVTAASYYLGDAWEKYAEVMDKRWQKKFQRQHSRPA